MKRHKTVVYELTAKKALSVIQKGLYMLNAIVKLDTVCRHP